MSVWDEVLALREAAGRRRLPGRRRGAHDEHEPPLAGWAPVYDDEGNVHAEPPPSAPTDTPADAGPPEGDE